MRITHIPLIGLILLAFYVLADEIPNYPSAEMENRSVLVFDGSIVEIDQVGTQTIPAENGVPALLTNYQGKVHVSAIKKGSLGSEQTKTMEISIRWRHTKDARYRGENGPELNVGESRRFYVEVFDKNDRGEPVAYLQGRNNVRALNDADAGEGTTLTDSRGRGDALGAAPPAKLAKDQAARGTDAKPQNTLQRRRRIPWLLVISGFFLAAFASASFSYSRGKRGKEPSGIRT